MPKYRMLNGGNLSGLQNSNPPLTHWGRVTHICVSKLTIIGSNNGLAPIRRQAIIWTNAGILLIGPFGTNFSEILIKIPTFSFKKMHLKMSSGKWRPSCLGLNVFMAVLCGTQMQKISGCCTWFTLSMFCCNLIQCIIRIMHVVRDLLFYCGFKIPIYAKPLVFLLGTHDNHIDAKKPMPMKQRWNMSLCKSHEYHNNYSYKQNEGSTSIIDFDWHPTDIYPNAFAFIHEVLQQVI